MGHEEESNNITKECPQGPWLWSVLFNGFLWMVSLQADGDLLRAKVNLIPELLKMAARVLELVTIWGGKKEDDLCKGKVGSGVAQRKQ